MRNLSRKTLFLLGALVVTITLAFIVWPKRNAPVSVAVSPPSIGATTTPSASTSVGTSSLATNVMPSASSAAQASVQGPPPTGCALQFSFAPSSSTVVPGGTITYTFKLSNSGTDTCTNASISAYYADNESFVSSTPKPRASNYYWVPGNLAPGASFTGTVLTTAVGANSIDNEACATADNSPDVCAYNVITIGSAGNATPAVATANGVWAAAFDGGEVGLWIWDSPIQMSDAYETQAVNTAVADGFNALYVTVDDYLPIAAMPAGPAKTAAQANYFAALDHFVALAKADGIAVDAEGGANDWAESANRSKGYALIDMVQAYDAAYPSAPLRGLQYDVESYLSSAYANDEAGVLQDFVAFVAESATRMATENPSLRFSVAIPHFYDDEIAWTPPINYDDTQEYTLTALLQALQVDPHTALIVMAYRNFLNGTNGTIALAHAEVAEASASSSTKIIVAQETGNVSPSYVTFYGESRGDLYAALAGIESAFGTYSAFGGVAIDYLDPFLALKQ